MAEWNTANDYAASAAMGFEDTGNAADNTNHVDAELATITSAFTLEERAAFKEHAKEAGWIDTVPANYNHHQDSDGAQYAVYEWAEEYGEVGPRVPELEEQLFGGEFRMRQGQHTQALELPTTVEGPMKVSPIRSVSNNRRFRLMEKHR